MTRWAAALLLCVALLFSCGKEAVSIDEALSSIDALISSGSLRQAEEMILLSMELAHSRSEWLTLIKRAYHSGVASGAYELLYVVSGHALDAIAGAEEIAALHVFACLRTGRIELAQQLGQKRLTSDRWSMLSSEAILKARASRLEMSIDSDGGNLLLSAVNSQDPEVLLRAAELFDEGRFILDAALLYASTGRMTDAADTISGHSQQFPIPALMLTYDGERYAAAGDIISRFEYETGPSLKLIEADIKLHLKNLSEAAEVYIDMLTVAPDWSWIPYANLARIYLKTAKYDEAQEIIVSGREKFPFSKQLGILEIEWALAVGDSQRANVLYDLYGDVFPSDLELAALQVRLHPTDANRVRVDSLLWEVFQKDPRDQRAARYLARNLLAKGDADGINHLLELWEQVNGATEWSLFLRGYAAGFGALPEEAAGYFRSAWDLFPRWQTAYNLAVFSRHADDFESALEYLRLAESELDRDRQALAVDRGRVRTETARALYEAGDFESARREAEYAADLDPGSGEANLILQLLESRSE